MFQVPLSRLSVRSANAGAIFLKQCSDGDVAVHGIQHFNAGPVQSNQRQVIVERGKPPFVFVVLISDKIGDVPGQERACLSCQCERFMDSDSWFHDEGSNVERRSLHDGLGFSQGPVRREFERTGLCL